MALKKLVFKPGINREITRYSNEGGWYECDKIRFRQGYPEKLGGWARISPDTYLGVCRSLWSWVTLNSVTHTGVGTHLKFYIERGGVYNDVTPIRRSTGSIVVTFALTAGSEFITVIDAGHGAAIGDFVTFSGAESCGGNITAEVLNQEYQVAVVVDNNAYQIVAKHPSSGAAVYANTLDTGNGGTFTSADYQIPIGTDIAIPLTGWGGGAWGYGDWGVGSLSLNAIRLWSQHNFGEDLVFGYRGGPLLYWDASNGVYTRGVYVRDMPGASDVPITQNLLLVSDVNRFVFAFGTNDVGTTTTDPMLVRWSDQENAVNWTPEATNQAGSIRLSRGTEIIAAKQARQEVLVWTDSSLYSMQYIGAPGVWGVQLVGDNISIASQNAVAFANGVAFWMGKDKFYMYDGRSQPLKCDVQRYVFNNINPYQYTQVFAGTNEAFHEIWWFYCVADSITVSNYVVYNYVEQAWYYGTLSRTAWLDSGQRAYPLAATYNANLVHHEIGVDDNETGTPMPIHATITSGQFDIDDGDKVAFVWRIMPDVVFDGSTTAAPSAVMTLLPLANSGAGYRTSEGGSLSGAVTRTATVPIEQYTGQVNVRVRGRQLALTMESHGLGVKWQLGSPRIDMRPDGRR